MVPAHALSVQSRGAVEAQMEISSLNYCAFVSLCTNLNRTHNRQYMLLCRLHKWSRTDS